MLLKFVAKIFQKVVVIVVTEEVDGAVREKVLVPLIVIVAENDTEFFLLTVLARTVLCPSSTISKHLIVNTPVSETT